MKSLRTGIVITLIIAIGIMVAFMVWNGDIKYPETVEYGQGEY